MGRRGIMLFFAVFLALGAVMALLGPVKPRPVVAVPFATLAPRALAEWLVSGRRDFLVADLSGRQHFTRGVSVKPGEDAVAAIQGAVTAPNLRVVLLGDDETEFERVGRPLQRKGLQIFTVTGGASAWRAQLLEPVNPDPVVASLSSYLQGKLVPPPPASTTPATVTVRPRAAAGGGSSGC